VRAWDWARQSAYFDGGLSSLPRPDPGDREPVTVFVARNHPVEFPLRLLSRLAPYAGVDLRVELSPYDDAFRSGTQTQVDTELIWPDWERLRPSHLDLVRDALQARTHPNRTLVLPAAEPQRQLVEQWRTAMGCRGIDLPRGSATASPSVARFSGSSVDPLTQLAIARALLTEWLLPHLLPPLKLIVVDLDETLYAGVLAEDGLDGLHLTAIHHQLNGILGDLGARGVLIVAVSRNRQEDVDALVGRWPAGLFPREYLVGAFGTAGSKGAVIREQVARFQTVPESVVYLDDNPGEILEALDTIPGFWPVLASATQAPLTLLAGQRARLGTTSVGAAAARRADAHAQDGRARVTAGATSIADLHRTLGTTVVARRAAENDLPRVAELLARTNQFNTSLRRTPLEVLEQRQRQGTWTIAVAEMTDSLADSGVIAVIVAADADDSTRVEEFAISCRALGRGLETLLAASLAEQLPFPNDQLRITAVIGPRNEPALTWLEQAPSITGTRTVRAVEGDASDPLLTGQARTPAEFLLSRAMLWEAAASVRFVAEQVDTPLSSRVPPEPAKDAHDA